MKEKFIEAYMDVAERFAELSTAKKLKVGAIIVKDNRIISIGYNGMPSGWTNECERKEWDDILGYEVIKTKPEVLHAEANAISKVARSNESCEGAVIFCTHTPCIECAKLIMQSGISEVYVRNNYKASRGCGLTFLAKSGIPVTILDKIETCLPTLFL